MKRSLFATFALFTLLGVACSGDGPPSPGSDASPSVSPGATPPPATATASPAPTTPAAHTPLTWTITRPQPMPADTVFIVEKGCYQCDGPATALERVSTAGVGSAQVRTLFEAKTPGTYITSLYVAPGGHDIWLFVCTAGGCGPLGPASADAKQTLHHSDDGGITWSEVAVFGADTGIVSVVAGLPILSRGGVDASGNPAAVYFTLQGGRVITTPAGAFPVYQSGGSDMLWQTEGNTKLRKTDGSIVFESERPFQVAGTPASNASTALVYWRETDPPFALGEHALIDGGKAIRTIKGGDAGFFIWVGGWIDGTRAVGRAGMMPADVPGATGPQHSFSIPSLINLDKGTVTPLELYGPLFSDAYIGRNTVRAIDTGDAAGGFTLRYVVTADSDCLNVRKEPAAASGILRCFADGVILWAKPGETSSDGITWLEVLGPDGTKGFASKEFLAR